MIFQRPFVFMLILFSITVSAQKRVNLSVDAKQNHKVISPYIYGTNDKYAYAKAKRLGGNRITNFNWENSASNGGIDYINSNDGYIPWQQDVLDNQYNIPGITLKNFHDKSLAQGAYSLITLPLVPYVAADLNGTVTPAQAPPSNRWKKVFHSKPGPLFPLPDVTDNNVYTDEEVNFLINTYGNSTSPNGVRGYALDNEPGIWFHSHPILWGEEHVTVKYLMDNSFLLADRVKQLDPGAEIFGPASWGVAEFENLQFAPDWDAMNKGVYPNFVDYYLAKMKEKSDARPDKKRLLDVLDLHWYPQGRNDGLDPFSNGIDYATNKARMEMTRSLWDPSYIENTWIGQDAGKRAQFLPFIPKMNEQINTYYPGTKFALSEYSYMGIAHPSGGIAQADALGIFGEQGLYLATYWGGVDGYIKSGFDAYMNYDGKGSRFGDVSVKSTTDDIDNASVHASIESGDNSKLHIIAMNKSQDESIIATIKINGYKQYKSAKIWAFDEKGTTMRQLKNVRVINNNEFEYVIPKLTVCHIIPTDEDLSIYPDFDSASIDPNAGYSDGTASFKIKAKLTDGDKNITKVTANLSSLGGPADAELILKDPVNMEYELTWSLPVGATSGLKDIKLTAVDATAKTTETILTYRVIKKTSAMVIWDGDAIKRGVPEAYYDSKDVIASSTVKMEKRTSGGNEGPGNLFMHFGHEQSKYNLMTFRMSNNGNPADATDISDFGYLEFYIKSNAPADADIEFSLRDASPGLNVSNSVLLKGGGYIASFNPDGYSKVKIPIADLTIGSDIKVNQIWQLNFLSNTATKGFDVWIDDVKGIPYSHPYKEPVISNLMLSRLVGYADDVTQITLSLDITDPDGDLKEVLADLSAVGGSNKQILTSNNGKYSFTFKVPSSVNHGFKKIRVSASDHSENSVDKEIEYKVREIANTMIIWDGDTKNTGKNIETNVKTVASVRQSGGNKQPISMNMHMDEMDNGFAAATWDWNEGTSNNEIMDFSDKRYLYFSLKLTPPNNHFDMDIYLKDFDINSTPSLSLKANGYVSTYTGNYQLVKIPLADMFTDPALKTGRMTRFGFLTNQLGKDKPFDFTIDDIYVSGSMVEDVNIKITDAVCGATGKVKIESIVGQSGNLSYFINGKENPSGISNPEFNNLNPGKYIIRIAGPNDFAYMEEVTVAGSVSSLVLTGTTGVGTVDVSVSGGSGNYTYLWNSGQTTQDLSGVASGRYTLVVTDVTANCNSSYTVDIVGPGFEVEITDAKCAPNGSVKIKNVNGASAPLEYFINSAENPQGRSNPEFLNLAPGNYTMVVRSTSGFELSKNIQIGGSLSGPVLSVAVSASLIDLTVSSGSGNYTYLWSNGVNTQDLQNPAPGNYSVEVTDIQSACKSSISVKIGSSPVPAAVLQITNACGGNNGAIAVGSVSGGNGQYRYFINGTVNPAGSSNNLFSGLQSGNYTIRIEDNDGFLYSVNANITSQNPPVISGVVSGRDITVSVSSGSGNYSYLWSTGATTKNLSGLADGLYTITVKDMASGCSSDLSLKVFTPSATLQITNAVCGSNGKLVVQNLNATGRPRFFINDKPNPNGAESPEFINLAPAVYNIRVEAQDNFVWTQQITISSTANPPQITAAASNGEIKLLISGGSGSYSYLWSNGAVTRDVKYLKAGDYTVTVKDLTTGCQTVLQVHLDSSYPDSSTVVAYPNPANSGADVKIRYNFLKAEERTLTLRDLLGRVLRRMVIKGAAGEESISLNGIRTGIYIIRIDGTSPVSRQLIVY